jgi:hypothetical protein
MRGFRLLGRLTRDLTDDAVAFKTAHVAAVPSEAALLVGVGIVDPCETPRVGKEVLMDEGVVIRQENAESGVRVIPSHDGLPAVLAVLLLMDSDPGFLGEGDMGSALGRAFPWDGPRNGCPSVVLTANQYATYLSVRRSPGVLPNALKHRAIESCGTNRLAPRWLVLMLLLRHA